MTTSGVRGSGRSSPATSPSYSTAERKRSAALLTEDALFEKVTGRRRQRSIRRWKKRNALIRRLSELVDHARTQGLVRAEVDAAGVLLFMCGLAHAARSAEVTAESPQAEVLLRVVFDGMRKP